MFGESFLTVLRTHLILKMAAFTWQCKIYLLLKYTVCYIKIFTLVETKKILLDLRIIVSAENILTFKKIFFLY